MQGDAASTSIAGVAGACVVAHKARLALSKDGQDPPREIVAAVLAAALTTRNREEGRRVLDDHASDVGSRGEERVAAPLLELEVERLQRRHFVAEARRRIFSLPASGRTERGFRHATRDTHRSS